MHQKSYKRAIEKSSINYTQTLIDRTGFVYDWWMCGITCPGCASLYTKIMRTAYPEYGKYAYYVYFYSNSYTTYGLLAGTYLTGVNIYRTDAPGIKSNILYIDYVLINPKTAYFDGVNLGATFYSVSPDDLILITWQSAAVY